MAFVKVWRLSQHLPVLKKLKIKFEVTCVIAENREVFRFLLGLLPRGNPRRINGYENE